jgi:hypothetical protein
MNNLHKKENNEKDQPGKNGLPIDAGMLTRNQRGFLEIKANTTMVAR